MFINLLLVRKLNPVGLFAFVCVWHCCVRCSHASRMVPLFLGSQLPEQPAGACDLKPGVFGGHAGEASSGLQHPFRNHVINSKPCSLSLSQERKKKKVANGRSFWCSLQGRKPGQEEMVRTHYLGVAASDGSDQTGSGFISSQ